MKFKLLLILVLFLLISSLVNAEDTYLFDTVLADGQVDLAGSGNNYGASTNFFTRPISSGILRSYISINTTNLTSLEATPTILEAYVICEANSVGATWNDLIYYTNYSWIEGTEAGATPSDGGLTSANQPCGGVELIPESGHSANCSSVPYDNISVSSAGSIVFNFTGGLQQSANEKRDNTSFMISADTNDNTNNVHQYDTKESVGTPCKINVTWVEGAAPSPTQTFTITANDTYDGVLLKNITVRISNSSFSFNDSTVNGTILVSNASVLSFDSLYQIDFTINDSGGYFNRTFLNINITDTGSLKGDLFQSVLRLIAIDGLNNQTISAFSASTNQSSDTTTTGEILILIKPGNFQLNVTALGFDKLATNFSITLLANNSLNVTMGSIFTFRLVREETNTPFNFNLTNSTDLTIFCPNETIRITFNMTNNISQIINCKFELMQMTVDYGVLGSYFRTLIPSFSQKNITWYLIDLIAGDTAIQKIIQLVDLTGDFSDATLRIKRAIPGETILKTMIEQKFDISSEVNLFLVKDALYTINIENDVGEIVLGNLIPTEAGTQTITLPKIDFVPQETTLGDNISWSYTFNITLGILRLQYVDTTNLTTLVRFTVKNGSDPNLAQLFQAESNNNSTVTITFNQVIANNTYVSELFFIHPGLSNFTETRPWYNFGGNFGALNLEGWNPTEQIAFKKWAAWIFLFIWGMFWSRRYIGIGMTSLVIWMWIFKILNWIDISNLVFGFVALLAVVGWIVEAIKKE